MDQDEFIRLLQTYSGISKILKTYTYQEIVSIVSELMSAPPEKLEQWPMGGYSKGNTSGAYQFVLEDLIQNTEHYDWFYGRLADQISQNVFTALMQFRLVPDMQFIRSAYDGVNHQYFDKSIVSCDENEIFVDCGGFVGDTTEDYIRQYETYKKIYVYEPSRDKIESCRNTLKKYKDVIVKKVGVGEKNTRMAMDSSQSSGSFFNAGQEQETTEVVSLDEDIKEAVTFIKMDMEGFEIPAIIGAKNHIKNDTPKLAICTYHIISDMWEIPKLINTINPDYHFYIRHYCEEQNVKTVLYAIPHKAKLFPYNMSASCAQKRIVAMAPYERGWSNVELIKDCGLIPYLLYKNHNHNVSMVGAWNGEYPNSEKYIKGVKMEFLPDGRIQTKLQYVLEHAKEIDALLLRGCYSSNFPIAAAYKQNNPGGKIYVGLDARIKWMDGIDWDNDLFRTFMGCCDVTATSCRTVQKFLNEKWPWKIEHIPNGWYDFSHCQKKPVFEHKKNRILTVARLGSPEKATEILLEAFAKIADKVPDWELRLVGGIESPFEAYIEAYFRLFPHLKKRVQFAGMISDRDRLFQEYQDARIFALPSNREGGTPNVIAEALYGGCAIAVSRIDACEDATDHGRCGLSAKIRDADEFAEILYRLCTASNLKQLSEHACLYSRMYFDMEKITARVNELLFGEVPAI